MSTQVPRLGPNPTEEDFATWRATLFGVVGKRRAAALLGADSARDCVVPGHAWGIGETWLGPPYEEAFRAGARSAGLCGRCECGWESPANWRDTEWWFDHLVDSDVDWEVVEREMVMRSIRDNVPRVPVRPWLRGEKWH